MFELVISLYRVTFRIKIVNLDLFIFVFNLSCEKKSPLTIIRFV